MYVCSAFWGQSFVGELTRLSAQAERKRISIDGSMDIDEGVDVKEDLTSGDNNVMGGEKEKEKLKLSLTGEVGQGEGEKEQKQQQEVK